ncbi:ankyrin repeat [Fusarium beomiforme]|uniref:Ankyrin repeat n=1 Tax=Fusarium beomiforme TaxID=44412 RepID=A0A9P5ACG6_9HYPO|nr:ankyrin repeat [Fusarium beomiforme]
MDPLSVIASTIAVIQAISSTYKAIQHLRGLPNEFNEVNRSLPLAKNTLDLARDQLQDMALDELSKKALQPLVSGCEEKAKMLQDVFEKVEKGIKSAKDGSVLDFYRTSLLRLGKAHRVETLMRGILKDLDALATNQLFKTATQSQMVQLKEAVDRLSNVESSVTDSELEDPGSNIMHNYDNATGHMSIISGQGHNINPGSGKFFNAHTMTFVQSNKDDKTRSDILQTLHTSPYLSRKNRNPDRVPGTCGCMLWVSANPGCGKTTCYFFFKDDFEDQRSARSALSCILHQLFTQKEDHFSDKIAKRFKAYKPPLTSSYYELWELWEVLVMASQNQNAGEIVCILDAFDECEDQERRELAHALRKFYDADNDTKNSVNLKFLVTSRPYDKIGRGFQPLNIPGLPIIHLKGESDAEISMIAQEIDSYIKHRVSRIRASLRLDLGEEQLLLEELRRIPNQTYLWVYLTLELIEKDLNIDKTKIREVTSSLPQGVDMAYEKILAKCSNSEEAKNLLHIIVAAERPLTLAEMGLALALRQYHRSYKDLNCRPDERVGMYVRDLCGLFVTITDSKIYLLHQTAKEFLVPKDCQDRKGSRDNQFIWKSSLQPPVSHRILCQICIWHLLFSDFETHPLDKNTGVTVSDYLREHVFLDYSATNWATHFLASGVADDTVIESLRQICDASSRRCLTWFRIYWASKHTGIPQDFTTLMIASYFGLEQIVKPLLAIGNVEVDSKDGTYQRSALSWASENGFDGVVKLLVKGPKLRLQDITKLSYPKGAEVDTTDRDGLTPLSYAALNGHMAIVKRLVKKGARVDSKDEIGGTPISYALCSGHEEVANRLMKGSQVDSVERIRRELLLSAAQKGHEPTVKRLLDNGAATEAADRAGQTPLSWAATNGYKAVVSLLLGQGADVNSKDKSGWTPLWWAASEGHEDIVRLLLEKGADVEVIDKDGRTPLWWASAKGHEAIVKLLLEKGADVKAKDKDGRTMVWWASAKGHEAIAKLLLEKGADVEAIDEDGRTPLSWAAANIHRHVPIVKQLRWAAAEGQEAMVKLLLEKDANVEAKDKDGRTPVWWAVINGHEAVVRLLLEKSADVEAKDEDSRTLLSWAAINGHEAVVRLLLEKGADVEVIDKDGRTPLWWASAKGHEAIVKLLLEKDANVEAKDKEGRTPLSWAAINGHEAVVRLLLEEDADIEAMDEDGRAPLWWASPNGPVAIRRAAMNGHEAMVKLLLKQGADTEAKDECGWTALWWAAANGHEAIVKQLLEHGADVETTDEDGQTPLLWATMKGLEGIVELLLEKGADTETIDEDGRTPLLWASAKGQEAIVKLLLEKGAGVEAKDSEYGQTPLWWAVVKGHEDIANLLLEQGADPSHVWACVALPWYSRMRRDDCALGHHIRALSDLTRGP